MRTLVQLSDLHFGRVDHALIEPLLERVRQEKPHVVVVSGDLTQRARRSQFKEARAFLDRLPQPQIVVPGNHVVPLYNVIARFLFPLANYERYISQNLEPFYADEEIAVAGVNTARSLTFKGGRISDEQIERVHDKLAAVGDHAIKIVATHHPFDIPDDHAEHNVVGRADDAMEALARCGADILLAGHLHTTHTDTTEERYKIPGYSALVVQAGTATSTRSRGEENSFNILRIEGKHVTVERWSWQEQTRAFAIAATERFEHIANEWIPASS